MPGPAGPPYVVFTRFVNRSTVIGPKNSSSMLALNAALNDAAVSAYGAKRSYERSIILVTPLAKIAMNAIGRILFAPLTPALASAGPNEDAVALNNLWYLVAEFGGYILSSEFIGLEQMRI